MAGKGTIVSQCRRLNRDRNVRHAGTVRIADFWPRAYGNFLISGGADRTRRRVLCEKLTLELSRGGLPTFLLTASEETEEELIRRAQAGEAGGRVFVTSPRYPNYLFFRGWDESDIARFLVGAAALMGYQTLNLPVYIQAFTHVLSRYYEPDLSAMLALAEYDDGVIADIGRDMGADEMQINCLRTLPDEGRLLRTMLHQLRDRFAPLAAEDTDRGYSLTAGTAEFGALYVINVQSRFQALLNLYFAEELAIALERASARLVLEDLAFAEGDRLRAVLVEMMLKGTETGVSTVYAAALLNDEAAHFGTMIVLLDSAMRDGDLTELLRPLGTYTHYEPMLAVHAPPVLMPLVKAKAWQATPEPGRLRVRPQDVRGSAAVLFGASGSEIVIADSLR